MRETIFGAYEPSTRGERKTRLGGRLTGPAGRLAAPAGGAMTALKWTAEWPPVQRLSDGSPSMSVDPLADYHLIHAVLGRRQVLGQAAARPHPNGRLR
ncbi:hypothetical protein [Streptomyces sp. NPDC058295]|uniref:hypothetical protein n=1 Tax=Streptomyces sp. NPDC058295 TaxID=3346431 RepID=UPI0036E6D0CA